MLSIAGASPRVYVIIGIGTRTRQQQQRRQRKEGEKKEDGTLSSIVSGLWCDAMFALLAAAAEYD